MSGSELMDVIFSGDALKVFCWYCCFVIAPVITAPRTFLGLLFGAGFTVIGVLLPYTMDHHVLKAMYGIAALTHAFRMHQLCVMEWEGFVRKPIWYRVAFVHMYHDLRSAYKIPSRGEIVLQVVWTVSRAIFCILAADYILRWWDDWQVANRPDMDDAYFNIINLWFRTIVGCARFFASLWLVDCFYRSFLIPFGLDVPPTMLNPLFATTLREFWSKRWNRVIQGILFSIFYLPLLRRGWPLLGLWFTFFVSGAVHAVPVFMVARGFAPALSMLLYFLVQPPLLMMEKAFLMRGHLWLLMCTVPFTPLFIEPLLLTLGL